MTIPPRRFTLPISIAASLIGAVALIASWEQHRAHILGAVPYLLLLACPLMHLFMHGGHGRHASGHDHRNEAGQGLS